MVEHPEVDHGDPGEVPFPVATGTATGVGSLPLTDPAAAAAFSLEQPPGLPAVPSLPLARPPETMLAQAATGLRGAAVDGGGALSVDADLLDPTDPFEDDGGVGGSVFAGLAAFLEAVRGRRAPVKLQVCGPVTLGRALHDAGAPSEVAFATAAAAVRVRTEATLAAFRATAPAVPLVVFVDEPGLNGSSHPRYPLAPDHTVRLLADSLATVEIQGGHSGVHCCGRADWSLVTQAGPRVLSMPVSASLLSQAEVIGRFLDRGGWLAWGAVPTDGPVGAQGEGLWRRLSDLWCALVRAGCDADRLRGQALVTPACGLAFHGPTQADRALRLATELGRRIRGQSIGVRLSVGA